MTREVVLGIWAAVGVGLLASELAARFLRPGSGPPGLATAADVLDRLSGTTARLLAVFVGWMWLGWHFFAR